ncbi:LysR family transcriptional regulator [Acidocella sp.]|uniref:LysR family transcriptional regulator n=1 Tax=Acidocella sp. TaxID=50710 RepID=UPI0026237C90|nr:LysR family transcriptional regulator [Acidocella sp.]
MDLREFDLNLLLVFDQILKTRKLSRAAEALGVTQPAISRSLARLRALLGDELFHRTPTGMEPTAYAAHLSGPVAAALATLGQALSQDFAFTPLTSARNFTLRLTDIGELTILPRLLRHLSGAAPGVGLTIVRGNGEALRSALERGEIDLAIGLIGDLGAGFFRRTIFRQGYVCVFRPSHPLAGRPLTQAAFAQAGHVVVTAAGTGHARIDELIEAKGIRRDIKLRVPHYASLERLLPGSDLIATVPEALVQSRLHPSALAHARLPFALPVLPIDMFWHARNHQDPANIWLRNAIAIDCALPAISPAGASLSRP